MPAGFFTKTVFDSNGDAFNTRWYDSTNGDGTGLCFPVPLWQQSPGVLADATHPNYFDLRMVGGTAFALGQALAAASIPVVLPSIQAASLAAPVLGSGENHVGEVGSKSVLIDVTLSLDTSAYASGDVLADTQAVTNALRVNDGTGVLQSLVLNDEDDQGAAMTLIFYQENRSLGTENSAPSISDANQRDCLGMVEITTADYKDLGGVRTVSLKGIGLMLKAASGAKDIYVAALNGTGAPTYTASGIRLRLGILQD